MPPAFVECICISTFIVRPQFYSLLLYSSYHVIFLFISTRLSLALPHHLCHPTQHCIAELSSAPLLSLSELPPVFIITPSCPYTFTLSIPTSVAYRNYTMIHACSQTSTWPLDIRQLQEVVNCQPVQEDEGRSDVRLPNGHVVVQLAS